MVVGKVARRQCWNRDRVRTSNKLAAWLVIHEKTTLARFYSVCTSKRTGNAVHVSDLGTLWKHGRHHLPAKIWRHRLNGKPWKRKCERAKGEVRFLECSRVTARNLQTQAQLVFLGTTGCRRRATVRNSREIQMPRREPGIKFNCYDAAPLMN